MKIFAVLVSIVLFLGVVSISAQSGRKVKAAPTPIPSVQTSDDPGQFSESRPTDSRTYSTKRPAPLAPKQPSTDTTENSVSNDDVIRVETNLITLPVSVYERSGVYVGNLRQNDFKVFEDGQEQEIAYFGTVDQPFSVVLIIDISPSTSMKIEQIQSAAMSFVDRLAPEDKVMVMTFDSRVDTLTDFTNDHAVIDKAIRHTSFGDGTSLYEAVKIALEKKLTKVQGRKAVVLFTDGVDTTSRGANFTNTLGLAEEGDSIIFPMYYNTFFDARGIGTGGVMSTTPTLGIPGGGGYGMPSSEDYARGRTYLEELARVTGGRMFRAESTTGGLSAAFEGIARELSSQYSIGYYPKDPGTAGQRKQIKVRVLRPNVAVRTKDNYIVGAEQQKKKT